jgi:hypothetical protein
MGAGDMLRHRRLQRRVTHVNPDDWSLLNTWVGGSLNLFLKVALGWLVRHVHTGAAYIKLPAVIHTAQPIFLVAPEEQGGPAVWAIVSQDPYLSRTVSKGYQILTEQLKPDGSTIGLR